MTQHRAADDFPMIRARMEELRGERARPRAADDFAMIRARMEELRRERAQVLVRGYRDADRPAAGAGRTGMTRHRDRMRQMTRAEVCLDHGKARVAAP